MIKNSTNSRFRFMSKIVRKNDQSNPLRKVGECLYRNGHGVYFAWFSVRGKQLKRSLKTSDKELARRRLAELRKVATRLHGLEDRNLRFDEVVRAWLESIQGGLKPSTYRRSGRLHQSIDAKSKTAKRCFQPVSHLTKNLG